MAMVVVVYDSVMYRRTGLVGRWAHTLERRFTGHAQRLAPVRSGELRAGIYGEVELSPGQRTAEIAIFSAAPHTKYVVQGTTGPIMSRRMWAFRQRTGLLYPRRMVASDFYGAPDLISGQKRGYVLSLRPGKGYGKRLAVQVKGQEANNFFADAAEATAATNPSLRGFSPSFRL